jgi:hypothetical protein
MKQREDLVAKENEWGIHTPWISQTVCNCWPCLLSEWAAGWKDIAG